LIERFFQSEMTHTEVAEALNQQPEQISAILGAIFIVALKSTNPLTRLNIFPELSSATPLDVEKAHLIAAGLPEDIADSLSVDRKLLRSRSSTLFPREPISKLWFL
jgi:hypothetical protein